MLFKKQGFPEEGDLVLCTVTSVQYHSVFVDMDEYGKSGMIHISEVSPGRIRNIRDFVKEGKKVVCKVLRINQEKGHIDLSLRRVNESEKRRKIDDIKKEQDSEKIVEIAAGKIGMKTEELYSEISEKIKKKIDSLHDFFEMAVKEECLLDSLGIDKKNIKIIEETIKQRIKPTEVMIAGKLKITTYAPNGIEIVKESLKKAEESAKGRIGINYL
ncbi:S1 RNA-binding domain-containing protein, partial [Candidatus Woesearchaeota archaeon]|nr:S1 RNA-binding domain-containing protein [Candidatus Woesearchaeota archaeon]